jgi:hypothetical protein
MVPTGTPAGTFTEHAARRNLKPRPFFTQREAAGEFTAVNEVTHITGSQLQHSSLSEIKFSPHVTELTALYPGHID